MKKNKKSKKSKKEKIKDLIKKINKGKIEKIIGLLSSIAGIIALFVALLVRQDTAELTKFSEKPMYYKIRIFPTNETENYKEEENYIRWNLDLVVDDFEIYKEKFLKINYNSVFTHVTYYFVYDYDIQNAKKFYYKFDSVDDRNQAQLRLEEKYRLSVSSANYSLTPNKKYCYILIHTETLSEQNLDLIFFKYNKNKSNKIDFIQRDDGVQVDITQIQEKDLICREYYTSVWSESEEEIEDISFMFDVYEDLRNKIKEQL